MVKYITYDGDEVEWIVSEELGHYIWNKINNSPRVGFQEGVAILVKLVKSGEDTNLVRIAGEDIEGADDWARPFSLMSPKMRMATEFSSSIKLDDPKEVRMAIYSRTNNGANFTHEFYQKKGEDAKAIIRVPVPEDLREEALSISDNYPKCEMVREQVGAFQERFNITDEDAPLSYREPHIECNDITSEDEIKEVFEDVLDVVERGVRASG